MNEKEINVLLEANYYKGVSEGIQRAMQMLRQEAEVKQQEEKHKWFGEDDAEEEAAEEQDAEE